MGLTMRNINKIMTIASFVVGVPGVFASAANDSTYNLAAIIYDTDASLHGAFTCSPYWSATIDGSEAVNYNACYYEKAKFPIAANGKTVVPCIGVTQGMVNDTLTSEKKMTLTEVGKKCFGDNADEAFAAMFNSTPGVNEAYCVDIPFKRTKDKLWEFNSDNYVNAGTSVKGGFYPGEKSPEDANMISERLPAAESKRAAYGPTFFCADNQDESKTLDGLRSIDPVEGVPVSELICNGPGWNGGIDCEGLFAAGSEFISTEPMTVNGRKIQNAFGVSWAGDGWGWSCENLAPAEWDFYKAGSDSIVNKSDENINVSHRWTSGNSDGEILTKEGRNQHYCLETHAKFTFERGKHFSFGGNDDMWVFIDNKLAVDLGGTHLPAPGYVDLDKFMGDYAVPNEIYDLDVYFCSRRTQMTGNIRIKTDLLIQETSGLSRRIKRKENGLEEYELVYTKAGFNCEAAMDFKSNYINNVTINYFIEDAHHAVIMSTSEMAESKMYLGGIDLTDRTSPKIDKNKIKWLPAGTYYLVAEVEGRTQKFSFKIYDEENSQNANQEELRKYLVGRVNTMKNMVAEHVSPKFSVKPSGKLSFMIVFDESSIGTSKTYAVLDMLGKVVQSGKINSGVTSVQLSRAGSYIVKVGKSYQRVEFK